jgi:hypothetical protein
LTLLVVEGPDDARSARLMRELVSRVEMKLGLH